DSINQKDLANLADIFVDSIPEMFTDEHALDYSSPLIFDEYDTDLEVKSDAEMFMMILSTPRERKSKKEKQLEEEKAVKAQNWKFPSTSDEDFLKKIYSNPLFDEEINPMKIDQHSFNTESDRIEPMPNHDSSIIISSKINSLFDEFVGKLTLLKSILPGFDETDCHPEKEIRLAKRLLYDNSSPRLSEKIVSDNSNADIESFSPSPIPNKDSDSHMEEINLPSTLDDPMPPSIEDDDYDSGRDILILEELLDNYSLSLSANESYHFDILSPYRPPAKPPDGNTGTLN
nr:hypothetical protein [Tanacetum cinerariifolium]